VDISRFKKLPLMGILRGVKQEDVGPLVKAVLAAGLETIEVTMNTLGASDIIREMVEVSGGSLTIGAGTVLSLEDLDEALSAGASFIVMPVCDEKIVSVCKERNIPVFPGALTPQEVLNAWNLGVSMVKVFPSSLFGPKYFKELKAPLDKIEIMAVGGVRLDNINEYFSRGASAVAFGASVFKKELLDKKDFSSIEATIRSYVEEVKKAIG
jgi:2-dehydro-3-deoxyphosphogluconate aldolase/(4S)-4-hydroxy-2-oxoglutarate aldolase